MSKQLATTVTFAPTLEVPDSAPPLPVDVNNQHLTVDDLFPENFLSMAGLERWLQERNADARILTVTAVSMELLYDPSNGEKPKDGSWRPCLSFAETESKLVINKSRAEMLAAITQSPLVATWANVGAIAVKPGIANGKAQIVITRPPAAADVDQINDDLFG